MRVDGIDARAANTGRRGEAEAWRAVDDFCHARDCVYGRATPQAPLRIASSASTAPPAMLFTSGNVAVVSSASIHSCRPPGRDDYAHAGRHASHDTATAGHSPARHARFRRRFEEAEMHA